MGQKSGRHVAPGQNLRRHRRDLHADMAVGARILRSHVADDLDLRRDDVQLIGGLRADLLEGRATAANTLDCRQLMPHLDAWQMGGQRFAARRLREGFIVAQRRGDQWRFYAGGFQDLDRGFGFVEQPSLTGRLAELLPTSRRASSAALLPTIECNARAL